MPAAEQAPAEPAALVVVPADAVQADTVPADTDAARLATTDHAAATASPETAGPESGSPDTASPATPGPATTQAESDSADSQSAVRRAAAASGSPAPSRTATPPPDEPPGRGRSAAAGNSPSPSGLVPPPVTGTARPRKTAIQDRRRIAPPARRWRITGVLIAVVVVLAAVLATVVFHVGSGATGGQKAAAGNGSQRIAGESAIRGQAVAWVLSQVGRSTVVTCDAVVCNDLAQSGFPAGDLNVLQPTAPDPYGSELLIATADVRSQFGSKLALVYAPELIARFGSGTNQIDIRVIAQDGPAAFRSALAQDLQARQHAGADLLANKNITVTAGAAALLRSGQVDLRLLTAIAFLSVKVPLSIVSFSTSAPGAAPGVPLRFASLATSDAAARPTSAAYAQSLLAGLRGLRPPYVPLSVTSVRLPTGQTVIRVEFGAPSPAGLISY